jgi:hypothetical protein
VLDEAGLLALLQDGSARLRRRMGIGYTGRRRPEIGCVELSMHGPRAWRGGSW